MAILGLVAVEGFILCIGVTFGAVSYALEHRALRARINAYSMRSES